MKNLIMKDQAQRIRSLDDKREAADILIKLLTGFALFCGIAITFAVLSIPEAEVVVARQSAYDHAISPELHSYINDSKIGRKQFVRNEDIE